MPRLLEITTIYGIEWTGDGDRVKDQDGDYGTRREESVIDVDAELADDDDLDSPADVVASALTNIGALEYSRMPFQPGGWYSHTEYVTAPPTEDETTVRLRGFTPEDECEIYERLRRACIVL
ncbi:hypothetical protein [Herbidospora cretacea]|uniref:hypothetical protein n=1 Tax=Herbidospora cretacea TaxID=28444 RepID=UPI000A9C796C|nr:hypothetical protein [Herbidospora cretacea]